MPSLQPTNLKGINSGDGEKYTVCKQDGEQLEFGTFFVIRSTDLFATPGLWAYAHQLETVLELAASEIVNLTEEQIAHLRGTADRVAELASDWQEKGHGRLKLPD